MGAVERGLGQFVAMIAIAISTHFAFGQPASPPPGYYDIPAGFDFPADKRILEQYRSQPNVPGQRLHVWNVFSGLASPTPDGKHATFETWFSEDETFAAASVFAAALRPTSHRFRIPNQFRPSPTKEIRSAQPESQAGGSAVLSFVLYNFAAYNHIRTNHLYQATALEALTKSGPPDTAIPQNRTIPAFPPGAVALKLVWWPVAKDKISAMPIWDPESNSPQATGNPIPTWARYIGVDATRSAVPDGETSDVTYDGQVKRGSHIVGLNSFHYIVIDADQAAGINSDGLLAAVAQRSFGRAVAAGDYAVLVAMHVTTKEINDWVWATFWWHDKPNDGPFAANRVGSIAGPWRNYLMNASYDLNLPTEADGSAHTTFNPWLEARFADGGHGGGGTVSNCMNCHNRASAPARVDCPSQQCFLPIYRGNPDLAGDPAYAPGRLRTDFLWSIPDNAQ